MSVTVLVPATSTRMTDAATLGTQLGFDAVQIGDNESLFNSVIDRVSGFITRYTGRSFAQETVKETLGCPMSFSSLGGFRLMLSRTPIKSITSIKYKEGLIDASNYLIEDANAGFVWNTVRWTSTTVFAGPLVPSPTRFTRPDYEVEYVAGYKMPGETDRDFPYELEQICLELAKDMFKKLDQDTDVIEETIGDTTVRYARSQTVIGASPRVQSVLSGWSRVA